ncbi:MAG: T9SS type A sorting domain-containing protein [Ignavibacteriae bacterium]|nr:T9SS type A sorting domain-containing protein [Ignavibacteriota bacterium]
MKNSHIIFLMVAVVITLFSGASLLPAQTIQDNLWVTNGAVYSTVRTGNTIYIGGQFSQVGPATGSCVNINSSTGIRDADFPRFNGTVYAVVADGSGGWYIGGNFTMVEATAQKYLAHILSDNTLDATWSPNPNGYVTELALYGSYIYVAGQFTVIGGQSRTKLAQIELSTGLATSWNPSPSNTVSCLNINSTGTTLYVGGAFTTISSSTRNRIASYSIPSGSLSSWNPTATGSVSAIEISTSTVYVGGNFTTIGGQPRNYIAELDASTGNATTWNPNANSSVVALAKSGNYVYAGGYFTTMGGNTVHYFARINTTSGYASSYANPNDYVYTITVSGAKLYVGGGFTTIGGESRRYIAALDIDGQIATSWSPSLNGSVRTIALNGTDVCTGGTFSSMGGVQRYGLAAIDALSGEATEWNPETNGYILSMALSGNTLYIGGQFSSVGGEYRNSLAAVDASTGSVSSWNPNVEGEVWTMLLSGTNLFLGGDFYTIGGVARQFLASVDATTGNPTSWNPTLDGSARALLLSGSTLYIGGEFTTINSQVRQFLAAFDVGTSSLKSWNPAADGPVYALALSGNTVYVGGDFLTIGSQTRQFVGAIDGSTGDPTAWNPMSDVTVRSLAISGNNVYAGGDFGVIGGQTRYGLACLDGTTGNATTWNPSNDYASLFSIVLYGQTVYIGGEFWSMANSSHAYFAGISDTSMSFSGTSAVKYRTFTPDTLGYIYYQKPATRPKYPNTANVIYETYKRMPTALLRVGKPGQYNLGLKEKAYVQPKAYTDVLKTLLKGTTIHTGTARGLDFDNKNALLVKKYLSLDPVKHNNTLLANLMALQVNIAASDTGVTPYGFADLVYDEGSGNPLSGMTMDEIAEYANNLMSNYEYQPLSVYENIDTTVNKINEAFSGTFDTTSWIVGTKLRVKGTKELGRVAFLRTSTVSRSRIIPTASYEDMLPSMYSLRQNYPNPFNPTTTIQFELGQNSLVTLKIYNMLGQEVATLLDRDEMYEGQREVTFNGKELASGVYFYRLVAEGISENSEESQSKNFIETKKMVLVK